MSSGRIIVVGDVHGCLVELLKLLKAAGYKKGVDRLIYLGDLVDRGEHSVAVVRFVREDDAECVLGNHEEKHKRWDEHEAVRILTGKPNPMRQFDPVRLAEHNSHSDENRRFLAKLPPWISFQDGNRTWIATHAGIPTDKPFDKQDIRKLIRTRHVHEVTGKYVSSRNPKEVPPNSVYWSEKWNGPESVIYGHIVQPDYVPRIDKRSPDVTCVGVDTGCCFGGKLTAAIFEGKGEPTEYISVQAERTYFVQRGGLLGGDDE